MIKYLDLSQRSNFLIYLGQWHTLRPSCSYSAANISLASSFSLQAFLISSLRGFFLGFGSITMIKSLILWFWDLFNSSFKIVGLTFFSSKIIRPWYYRRLLLALAGTTSKRRLRASGIIVLVLGLQVITKLNQERNLAQ